MNYPDRLARLQKKLRGRGLQAMLVSNPENRRYLCGYRGGDHGIGETSGLLVVPAKGDTLYLLTDFRYELQARQEAPGVDVRIYKAGAIPLLVELIVEIGAKNLAFESSYTLHSVAEKLGDALNKRNIIAQPVNELIEDLRISKDEDEIEILRQSVRLNEQVFCEVFAGIAKYPREIDLALAIETTMRRRGAECPSFRSIVACGENGALPHAVPGVTPLVAGKPITVDMGLILQGYCSDMTRNFVIGKADDRYLELHRLVRKAQLAGMAEVRAGARCCDVDKAARKIIADAGYGPQFGHGLGHGVGLAVHEAPRLSFRSRKKLRSGMIVTVEPGIYIPGWGGIRLENMVVVREDGCENLNSDTTWLDI
jgi:Xaa-Pro aminopeptidase